MDSKRLVTFAAIALAILFGWQKLFPASKSAQTQHAVQQQQVAAAKAEAALTAAVPTTVTTDTVKAVIDEKSSDLRRLTLLKYKTSGDANKDFVLFDDGKDHTYVAQVELLDAQGNNVLGNVGFIAPRKQYTLNGDKTEVRLSVGTDGLKIDKVYTFTKGSYLINVRFDATDVGGKSINLTANYRVVHDSNKPEGQGYFTQSYVDPVVYTPEGQFEKVTFSGLDDDFKFGKNEAEYAHKTNSGWLGMIEHHFMVTQTLQPKDGQAICAAGDCQTNIKRRGDNLYSAGVSMPMAAVAAGGKTSVSMNLHAGPQTTSVLAGIADKLQLAKDRGKVHWFASPLFWLLNKLHEFIGNWGWLIIALTIIVKAVLYPLANVSCRSMAKMRAVVLKLQAIKEKHGDDRMAQQQAMMQMYKDGKINPFGGRLPTLLQIPVFIGLYQALFTSAELRRVPWLDWITDLSRPGPFYILPLIMAGAMFAQTFLNPPSTDPMQAKMMKIMLMVFSVMFFFLLAGLVLYWVASNLLTIAQQWYTSRNIGKQCIQGGVVS